MQEPRQALHVQLAVLLGILALGLYISTLSYAAYPGESAAIVVRFGGVDPVPPAYHPIYATVAGILARIDVTTLPFRLGLISALAAAAGVVVQFLLSSAIRRKGTDPGIAPGLLWVSGLGGAAYLMLSTPYWGSANRAHSICFHLTWLLIAFALLYRHLETRRLKPLCASLFLFGLGLLEWSLFPVVTPVVLLYLILHGAAHPPNQRTRLWPPILAMAIGFAVFVGFFAIRLANATTAAAPPLGASLFGLLAEHVRLFRGSYGGIHAVLITVGSVIPWLMIMASGRQERVPTLRLGSGFLNLVLTGLTLFLFAVGTFAPELLTNLHGLSSVPPYVLLAVCYGHVLGDWYLRLVLPPSKTAPSPAAAARVLVPGLGVLVVIAVINFSRVDTRPAVTAEAWAIRALESIPDHALLIAHGPFYNQIILAAEETGDRPASINVARNRDPDYRAHVARHYATRENEVLAARDLHEWLGSFTPADLLAPRPVVTQSVLPSWRTPDVRWLPVTGLYCAEPASSPLARDAISSHRSAWDSTYPTIHALATGNGFVHRFFHHILVEASRNANDLAVLCMNENRFEDADRAINAARSLDPANLGAAYNQFLLYQELGRADEAAHQWNSVIAVLKQDDLASMEDRDGRLWKTFNAASLRFLLKDLDALPATAPIQACVAALLTGNSIGAAAHAETQTTQQPGEAAGWLMRGHAAVNLDDTATVDIAIEELDRLNATPVPLILIAGERALQQDDEAGARRHLENAVERQPADLAVLESIVRFNLRDPENPMPRLYVNRLLSLDPGNPLNDAARELPADETFAASVLADVESRQTVMLAAEAEAKKQAVDPVEPPVEPPVDALAAEPAEPIREIATVTTPEPPEPPPVDAATVAMTAPPPAIDSPPDVTDDPTPVTPRARLTPTPPDQRATYVVDQSIGQPDAGASTGADTVVAPHAPQITDPNLDDELAPVPLSW